MLNDIAVRVPWLLGGAADLAPSTKTALTGAGDFERRHYGGRNLHFGIREHGMCAFVNGLAQDPAYRDHVLPNQVRARVPVEEAGTYG